MIIFFLLNIIYIQISSSSFEDSKKVMLISCFILRSLPDSCCPCYCQPPSNLFFIFLKAKGIREPHCFVFDLNYIWITNKKSSKNYLLCRKTNSHWYYSKSSQTIECCEDHFKNLAMSTKYKIVQSYWSKYYLHHAHFSMNISSWTVVSKANCCQCDLQKLVLMQWFKE